MATRQYRDLKPDDLKSGLQKAVDYLKTCKDYTTAESTEAFKTLRAASDQQHLQSLLGEYLTQNGYATLLVTMHKFLKEVCDNSEIRQSDRKQAASNLCTMVTAYAQLTAASVHLCSELQNCDALSYLIVNLNKAVMPLEHLENNSQREIILSLEILYHCVRLCSEFRFHYRKLDVVDLLTKFLDTPEVMIKTTSLIILAYVVEETESEKLATTGTDGCVNFLIFRLKAALHSRIHRAGGFTAAGLLDGMIHLMASDANKVKVLQQGALPLILRMLQNAFSDEEQILAATALWKLAFIDGNRTALKKDLDVIQALKDCQTSHIAALRDACSGALWEIYEGQIQLDKPKADTSSRELRKAAPINSSKDDKREREDSATTTMMTSTVSVSDKLKPHIMISYQWDSQSMMVQLKNSLQQAGYNVWMDVEKMEGNILSAMANAVEEAAVVLVCMSHKYKESNNCRTEASYAYKMKKPIVPLLVEDDYDPDGWLGALVGMLLYFKVNTEEALANQLPSIKKELGGQGRHNTGAACVQAASNQKDATKSSVSDVTSSDEKRSTTKQQSKTAMKTYRCLDWTTEQVQQWLISNDLPHMQAAMKLYDGKCLAQMHKLSARCPEYFHNVLKTELKLDLLSVIKFTIALDEISIE